MIKNYKPLFQGWLCIDQNWNQHNSYWPSKCFNWVGSSNETYRRHRTNWFKVLNQKIKVGLQNSSKFAKKKAKTRPRGRKFRSPIFISIF